MHSERKHAKFSASNARWHVCYGQPNFVSKLPPMPPQQHAIDGTAAHEYLQTRVENLKVPDPGIEIRESVAVVIEHLDVLALRHPDLEVYCEREYAFPQNIVPPEDCGGMFDIVAISRADNVAYVIDFKHGRGRAVEVRGNKQLKFYAVLAQQLIPPGFRTVLVIIQPRREHVGGPVREWEVDAVELIDFTFEVLDALTIGSKPDAPLAAGPHCEWCPGQAVCPAAQQRALAVLQAANAKIASLDAPMVLPDPSTMDVAMLARAYEGAAAVKGWFDAVKSRLVHEAMSGHYVPGWKLAEAQAKSKWTADSLETAQAIIALSGFALGLDDVMPRSMAGITEMRAAVARIAREQAPKGQKNEASAAAKDALAFLMTKESSGNYALVPETSTRQGTTPAARTFEGVVIPPVEMIAPPPSSPAQPVPMWPGVQFVETDPSKLIGE